MKKWKSKKARVVLMTLFAIITMTVKDALKDFYSYILKSQTQIINTHIVTQSRHGGAILNSLLPNSCHQMWSKWAKSKWFMRQRSLAYPQLALDTQRPFQIHLAKPPKSVDLEFTKCTISNETTYVTSNSIYAQVKTNIRSFPNV